MASRWSPQQEHALKQVAIWLQHRTKPVFRLFGYAGTGKTTLAKQIAADTAGKVLFAAFTGKAAQVLASKGCTGAGTIHSLIYRPDIEVNGEPRFKLNHDSEIKRASLVIIDECSMVGEDLAKDILSFGVPVLVLGDPGQLPPVNGTGYFTSATPDIVLTDIQRQAADNPIIHLAQLVREGRGLPLGTYGNSRVIAREQVTDEMVLGADQVLVGLNATRRNYNAGIRAELGFAKSAPGYSEAFPVAGERLVCLRNNREAGLLNGSQWRVEGRGQTTPSIVQVVVRPDEGSERSRIVNIHSACFRGGVGDMPWSSRKVREEFDFGYAMTVHKAQGSQWDNVVLFDESGSFRENRDHWLYTGLTRAADRVTVVSG